MDEILLNVESCETRIAHLKAGELHNIVIERSKNRRITGNIYRGVVSNVLQNIQSAFIDINEGNSGFIHIRDVLENSKKFEDHFDIISRDDSAVVNSKRDIREILQNGQSVLVQVIKEPIGSKGTRLTSNISIAGRYIVLLLYSSNCGISRKIEASEDRERLKALLKKLDLPSGMGVIFRTISVTATDNQLIDEVHELVGTWEQILQDFNKAKEPCLLYQELSVLKKAVITAIDKKFSRLLVDNYSVFNICKQFSKKYDPDNQLAIELYKGKVPLFEKYGIENALQRVLQRKVWLSCGGYLYFDKTEAMYTIDVNSGRSTNKKNNNLENSIVLINLEAADEIARQIRLRNIGGLIICDFIDMKLRKNKTRVLQRLKDNMKNDSAKNTILGMNDFCLVALTRQRDRGSLEQTVLTNCPYCRGSGSIRTYETTAIEIERSLKKVVTEGYRALRLVTHPNIDNFLELHAKKHLVAIARKNSAHLEFETNDTLHLNACYFQVLHTHEKIEI